jgi:hypothetical protein
LLPSFRDVRSTPMTAIRYSAPPSSTLDMTVLAPRTTPSRNPRTAISSHRLPENGVFTPRPLLSRTYILGPSSNEGKKGGRRWGTNPPFGCTPPSHNIADRPFGRGSRAIIAAPGSEPTKAVLFTQLRRGNVLGTPVYAGSRTNSADNSPTRGLSQGCSRTSRYLWPSFASLPLDRRGWVHSCSQ